MTDQKVIETEAEMAAFLFGLKAGAAFGLHIEAIGEAGCYFESPCGKYAAGYWTATGAVVIETEGEPDNDPIPYASRAMLAEAREMARAIFDKAAQCPSN